MRLPTRKTLKAAYHLAEFLEGLEELSPTELNELAHEFKADALSASAQTALMRILDLREIRKPILRHREELSFEQFRFDIVMSKLRNAIMHSPDLSDVAEIDWLLKIVLASPAVFSSVREVDNFLANMTGVEHSTKSTGRDRIIEWYMKYISTLSKDEQNKIYFKIAKYIFANSKSNYKEWKDVLYNDGGR
jgi:hypothetical protein